MAKNPVEPYHQASDVLRFKTGPHVAKGRSAGRITTTPTRTDRIHAAHSHT